MPSITDIQQQPLTSSNNSGKSIPSTTTTTTMDMTNLDPITQAILLLEKKQRNLGKRKEKLEGYQEEAKKGKELLKDQQDALAKYSDVLGQIECLKELNEQFKKIQTDSARNQKRLSKQAADEKRQFVSQNLRQYAQIRYLLEHQPTSLKPEESSLLDKLSTVIIPLDNSSNSISRSVDTVLSIYQNGSPSIIKNLTEKTPQEVREVLEELIKKSDVQQQQQQQQQQEEITSSSSVPEQEQQTEKEQSKEVEQTNIIQPTNQTLHDYPLQFDTRNQHIPLEQIIQDTTFFPNDLNNELEDNNRDQSPDPKQYLATMTVVNSNINDQSLVSMQNQRQDNPANVVTPTEEHQIGEQGQYRRGNGSGNRNYNRGGPNHYNQHQWRGPRGGRYHNSYGSGQRPYHENNRGRGGQNNYRNNRGGAYRGNNRGYNNNNNNNGNGYQNSAQYQQAHSAPPS